MGLKSVVMLKSMIKRAIRKHKNRRADHDYIKNRKATKVHRSSSRIDTTTTTTTTTPETFILELPPRPHLATSTSTSTSASTSTTTTTATTSSASTIFVCPLPPSKPPVPLEIDAMPTLPANILPTPYVPDQPPTPTSTTFVSVATTPTASHFPSYASRRHSSSSHRRHSSASNIVPASDLPTSRRSSFETPRSRRNSVTLQQSVPFQEEWQDDLRTQEDLMAQFRKVVDSVHEAVVSEEGVIEEEDIESGMATPSAEQQQKAITSPSELFTMANKESTTSVDVVVRDVHGEESTVYRAENGELEMEIYDDTYWQKPEVPHESEEKKLSRLSRLSRSSSAGPQRYLVYHLSQSIKIRDFAHPSMSPLHYGLPPSPSTPTSPSSQRSSRALSEASDFAGRQARALYDFDAENPSECSFREGELIWVQYRQCPGWLVADVRDETGLVPENYVEILEEDAQEPEEVVRVVVEKMEQLKV